jgi:hypothetical protein
VIIRKRVRWAGHATHIGEMKNAYNILVRKPEGKKPLGRLRHGWKEGIKMSLKEISVKVWTGFISSG